MKLMNKLGRTAASLAVVAAATTGVTVSGVGTASAGAYGCAGSEVSGSPRAFYGEGDYLNTVVAYVHTYWDGTNNCEVAVKQVFAGQSTRTAITLYTNWGEKTDSDYYSWYAGPVVVKGVGSCVWEEVDMWDDNGREIAQSFNGDKHNCG
ncbi:hypothetical protein E6W39_04485 [Kitasatospora acidiphila]|uniref:Spore-associated protein A n=1 Tax=Kitasatospora acidiphila TaxID=2567942 RepID=A0A540VY00_9ACTN|nr:hypothetical protein [Kitasatospora acidiphila]TQF01638.1 hypothetical protein E6W39_04485 [Kitasatospora acidiphila]